MRSSTFLVCYSSKLLLLLVLLQSFSVRSQGILKLEDAVRVSLENSYNIKIAKTRIDIAQNENTRGNAGMLPTVTGGASKNFNTTNTQLEFFDPNLPILERSGVKNNNSNVGVNLNWTVFDGLSMFITKDRLETLEKVGREQSKQVVVNTVGQVMTAYYEVIRQQMREKNLKKGLEISNDRLKLARDRYEVGQGPKVDLLSAQVDYNEDDAALKAQQLNLESAKINLNTLMVRDLNDDFAVQDSIPVNASLNLEILKETMKSQNPVLIQAALNKKIADLDIKNQKAAQHPQIDLLAGYNYNVFTNGAGAPQSTKVGENFVLNYGLRATINIYDGQNQKRRIQNAMLSAQIAEDQISDLKNQLNSMVERTYLQYKNAQDLIKLESENYKIAQQNIDIAFERFKVGNSTSYELREVQRNAVSAQTRLIEALYTAKVAEIELQRLSGSFVR
jgi:outer membrane protein